MKVIKWHEVPKLNTPCDTDGRRIYDDKSAQIVHLTLKPMAIIDRHTTPVDVLFYVLEGQGVIEIGEEKISVDKDTLVESPANIPHALFNDSEQEDFRVLVIKLPNPKFVEVNESK